jgi:hypothetical protein
VKCLERVRNIAGHGPGFTSWLNLESYPALILLYSSGIAAIAANKYDTLSSIWLGAFSRKRNTALIRDLYPGRVMDQNAGQQLPGRQERYTPVSDQLFDHLRSTFRELLPDDHEYEMLFDRYEYLFCLVSLDLELQEEKARHWAPFGRFGWRAPNNPEQNIVTVVNREMEQEGVAWPPLPAGFFGGSPERFLRARAYLLEIWRQLHWL